MKVFIVEDSFIIQMLLETAVEEMGQKLDSGKIPIVIKVEVY